MLCCITISSFMHPMTTGIAKVVEVIRIVFKILCVTLIYWLKCDILGQKKLKQGHR